MADESTPLETAEDDTSANATDTSAAMAEPEAAPEPKSAESEAGKAEDNGETLIFGKYKTIEEAEKGYKEAEKAITRSAELEKKLKAYQDMEEKAFEKKQETARALGFNDAKEQEISYDVKNFEFLRYTEALGATLEGDKYLQAYNALARYQQTLNPRDLALAKACFLPETVAAIAEETALYKQKAYQDYSISKTKQAFLDVQKRLSDFAKETGGWLDAKERQDIVGMAVNLTGGNVDFAKVKELVDAVEAYAVKSYQEKSKSEEENGALQKSLQVTSNGSNALSDVWITKEQYMSMSDAEADANYDKIARQIELEKQGKIPRMLT